MSTEARQAPVPRRPSSGPAPASDGQDGAPDGTDVTGRTGGPGFFERPNRVNRAHRSDVSTDSTDTTGQDQPPGPSGAQLGREDRTSRGGAVAQGEQDTEERPAGRPAPAERITRPRHPDLRPPQGPSAAPPPPASARFPDTPPATADRSAPAASPMREDRRAEPFAPSGRDGGGTPAAAPGWGSDRTGPRAPAGREDRGTEPKPAVGPQDRGTEPKSVFDPQDRGTERPGATGGARRDGEPVSFGRESGRGTPSRPPYRLGAAARRPGSVPEPPAPRPATGSVPEPPAPRPPVDAADGPRTSPDAAGASSAMPGSRRPEGPRDVPAPLGTPEPGAAWSPHHRTFPVPQAPPRPAAPPQAAPPPRPARPPAPASPPLPPRPVTPPPAAGTTGPLPDPAMSWAAAVGTPVHNRPVVTFGEPEGYDERGWGRSLVRRVAPRTAAAAACVVLGLGLIGGAVTGSWLVDDDTAVSAATSFGSAAGLWHDVPVDELFPPTVQGTGAGPGGADRTWTRIAVAPATGCAGAFDPLLSKALAPVGCRRLIRATYTDATQSYVTTVGLLFTNAEPAGMTALAKRFEAEHLDRRTDLMPLPYAAKGTAAERFGKRQRASWTISVLTDAPVVAYAVSGWADGRTVDTPQSAADAEASGATTAAAQAGLGNEAQGLADRIERRLRQNTAGTATEKPS
ncbi:hypothetical protein ACWC4D_28685 [Streptomyces sp. NPDC001288]|uniref:hypothetical protein n=1 Tax=Streptomyces sp. NPDC001297 TaxID=3364559 RepID=UPI0036B5C65D